MKIIAICAYTIRTTFLFALETKELEIKIRITKHPSLLDKLGFPTI